MAPSSSSLPNKVAPGDSILVYWDGDRKWYGAEVVSVRENLDCEVVYEDGESEVLNLGDVKYMMRKWKSSTRERKSRRGGDHGLLSVQEMLFSMEDRIPPSVAFEKDLGWWKQWHDRVSKDVKSMNIRGTMNAALEFALQIKPEILLPWWATNSEDWKMRLRTASTVAEAQLVVRDLQFKAIDWFHARELFTLDITRSGNEANGTQNPDHGKFRNLIDANVVEAKPLEVFHNLATFKFLKFKTCFKLQMAMELVQSFWKAVKCASKLSIAS